MPDAAPRLGAGGNVNRAWAQRRGLPPRPPPPLPRRRPSHHAAGGRGSAGGEVSGWDTRRGGVAGADREVAVGASADPASARGNAATVAGGEAPPARDESGGGRDGGVGSKRPSARPELPPSKRRAVTGSRQFPRGWRKDAAPPLADAGVGSRIRHDRARDNGGSDAWEKLAVARTLTARKDGAGALSGAVAPNAAGPRVLRNPPSAAPMANAGHHGSQSGIRKSSASQDRGKGAGTDELRGKKVLVQDTRFPPRAEIVSATSTLLHDRGKDGRHSREVHRPLASGHAKDRVMQAPMSPDMLSLTHKKRDATARGLLDPMRKMKPNALDHGQTKITLTSVSGNKWKLDDEVASSLTDDILRALDLHERKLGTLSFNSSSGPSVRGQGQYRYKNADARSRFKIMCKRFEFVCRALVRTMEKRSLDMRIDLLAAQVMKKLPCFTKDGPIVGEVPGVVVGDLFIYRAQLVLAGIHSVYRKGIDTTIYRNGMLIAVSIVASGGYPDELGCSGELIYTGSGGKPAGKKKDEDQKLKDGNLALKNCIYTKTPVRVIHGFKCRKTKGGSHWDAKLVPKYTYDGLYLVVDFWMDGQPGSRVFKFKLKKIPGQPELPMHIADRFSKLKRRPGECVTDISEGKEATSICVINTVNYVRPAPFRYTTRIIYPFGLTKKHNQGCDCTNGCSDSASCACAVKNGGEIPFTLSGAVVKEKPVIFECGPSCKCPPSCHNRVSQHGMKIPLEVFRTTKTGWGVRSLRSISSGSFICEYVGKLLHRKEADMRRNSDYLFDIGLSHGDENLCNGLLSSVSDIKSSSSCSQSIRDVGFTIDATECGNIGRFINHSCSPNLYAQNVLWDHDDKRMPHVMFFAAETIPPLQELTYDYNYEIEHVRGVNGSIKSQACQCGSPECCGRLYGMAIS